eukprot:7034485-Alexandrium_andersonii.AAC.1
MAAAILPPGSARNRADSASAGPIRGIAAETGHSETRRVGCVCSVALVMRSAGSPSSFVRCATASSLVGA